MNLAVNRVGAQREPLSDNEFAPLVEALQCDQHLEKVIMFYNKKRKILVIPPSKLKLLLAPDFLAFLSSYLPLQKMCLVGNVISRMLQRQSHLLQMEN